MVTPRSLRAVACWRTNIVAAGALFLQVALADAGSSAVSTPYTTSMSSATTTSSNPTLAITTHSVQCTCHLSLIIPRHHITSIQTTFVERGRERGREGKRKRERDTHTYTHRETHAENDSETERETHRERQRQRGVGGWGGEGHAGALSCCDQNVTPCSSPTPRHSVPRPPLLPIPASLASTSTGSDTTSKYSLAAACPWPSLPPIPALPASTGTGSDATSKYSSAAARVAAPAAGCCGRALQQGQSGRHSIHVSLHVHVKHHTSPTVWV